MLVKISEIIGSKSITSKKNGKSYEILSYRDTRDQVFESFDKLEPGREYEGEMTSNQYGNSFKLEKKTTSPASQANLRVEALQAAAQLMPKIPATSIAEAQKSTIQIAEFFLLWLKGEVPVVPTTVARPVVKKEEEEVDILDVDF